MMIERTCPIDATPAAEQAIARLRAEHGAVILHVTGGCCDARTPLCLSAGDLCLGPRDVLLGVVEGVPVYEMQTTPQPCCCANAYLLDVVSGVPVGFSIAPGDGKRFAIRASVETRSDTMAGLPYSVEDAREGLEEVYA